MNINILLNSSLMPGNPKQGKWKPFYAVIFINLQGLMF